MRVLKRKSLFSNPWKTDQYKEKFLSESKVSWPKNVPHLSEDQKAISDDFMKYWHEVLPKKYGVVESFNHKYSLIEGSRDFLRTLEIGIGLGEHLNYEKLTPQQEENYYGLDFRKNMLEEVSKKYKNIKTVHADCQKRLNFDNDFFDRILAIHVLEHLPSLPSAIQEIHRICNKKNGYFSIVIPCEGGLAYSIARKISAERIFKKRYNQSYDWIVKTEHINKPLEILSELEKFFYIKSMKFFPMKVKMINFNLCIGCHLIPRQEITPLEEDSSTPSKEDQGLR